MKTLKHHVGVLVEKNAFIDEGEGVVTFPKGLPITDDSIQRNGTRYDIASMDVSEYKGQVTADHVDTLSNIIAKVSGVQKTKNQLIVNKITYAVTSSPLARLAYNLLVGGFSTDFSIETYGPFPGDEGVYMNSKLIGLSQVVVGNNKGAAVNAIVKNSLEQSKEDGLDISEVEEAINTGTLETSIAAEHTEEIEAESEEDKVNREAEEAAEAEKEAEEKEAAEKLAEETKAEEEAEAKKAADVEEAKKAEEANKSPEDKDKKENNNKNEETHEMKFVTIKNSRDFPLSVTFKNAAGDENTVELEAGKTVDVSDDQKEAVEAQIVGATAPKVDNSALIAEAVKNAMTPFMDQYTALKEAFDKSATEPAFKAAAAETEVVNGFAALGYKERHAKQINAAWEYLKLGNISAANTLSQLNEVNLAALKTAGKVENGLSIADFGNFVISPELLTEIQGYRNDYSAVINATDWRETPSLQFAWLRRSGDIDMQNVKLEPGIDGNGNLKPISEYSAEPVISDLEELAAVTPVCNSATRFLAVDLLGDVARGYRNDFDRKRAQLVVARLQQAVAANPAHSTVYSVTPTAKSLTAWVQLWAKVAQTTINGYFIFNMSTFATIQQAAVEAGSNGPLAGIFLTGDVPTIFGRPFIVVPNDLLPSLNSGATVTVVVDSVNVVINHAVFYLDLSNFTGRTSGGLQYDLSTEAAYEVGGVVKSAYQRNELVLRGSFFRGGAVLDDARVAGMSSAVATTIS